MADISEKHFCVDAGIGTKLEGCPYSLFEDGRDVMEFITAPEGYEFVGFKLEALPNNQIYDGRLVAQFKRLPFKERATNYARGIVIAVGILAVLGIIVALTISVFKPKKTNTSRVETNVTPAESLASDTVFSEESLAPETIQTVEAETTQTVENEQVEASVETPPATTTDINSQFKQEFWALIHQRSIQMDDYDGLYKQYKNQVEGEEYDYLRFTILQNAQSYEEWYKKLRKIPKTELESIENIETLKNKIKEIQ